MKKRFVNMDPFHKAPWNRALLKNSKHSLSFSLSHQR